MATSLSAPAERRIGRRTYDSRPRLFPHEHVVQLGRFLRLQHLVRLNPDTAAYLTPDPLGLALSGSPHCPACRVDRFATVLINSPP